MIKKIIAAGFVLSFSAGAVDAQTCPSYPNTLTNGQPADANQVMGNFNSIRDCVNNKGRELLTVNRTYFVRADGNDGNTGLVNSAAGAFLTLPKAAAVVSALDLNGFAATVQVGNGTYTAGFAPRAFGIGTVQLLGNETTPGNVIISTTGDDAVRVSGTPLSTLALAGVELRTTTSGSGLSVADRGNAALRNVNFGATAGLAQINVRSGGRLLSNSVSYRINGNAQRHINCYDSGSSIILDANTVTLTGTPAFSVNFAEVAAVCYLEAAGSTYTGAATGTRYTVTTNAVINTAGGGANYFPGSIAGAATAGGQYN